MEWILGKINIRGTNVDESLSMDYCSFCFLKGNFTNNITLNEQVEMGLNYSPEYKYAKTQDEKIKIQTKEYLSNLKRWHCTCTDKCATGYNPNCTCTSSDYHCTEK